MCQKVILTQPLLLNYWNILTNTTYVRTVLCVDFDDFTFVDKQRNTNFSTCFNCCRLQCVSCCIAFDTRFCISYSQLYFNRHVSKQEEDYLGIVEALHERFPKLYMKGFTGVEITHFAEISGLPVEEVLRQLRDRGGLQAIAGGGAEILSDRVRGELCPNKATADEWLTVARTAHKLGIKSNASMLYGHIETMEERVDHLLRLRELQDETGGFQTFICFPFLPKHTELGKEVKQTSMWDDLRTMAISRLMLDNFKNIKAYWVMLTVPVAQVALSFGANDIDGTVHKETILHDAGAQSPTALSEDNIIRIIKEAGRTPAACDCNFNILRIIE